MSAGVDQVIFGAVNPISIQAVAVLRYGTSGQAAQVYVRERVVSRNIQRGSSGVVLFVHGIARSAVRINTIPQHSIQSGRK